MEDLIREYSLREDPGVQEAIELLKLHKDQPAELLRYLDQNMEGGPRILETLYMDLLAYLQ